MGDKGSVIREEKVLDQPLRNQITEECPKSWLGFANEYLRSLSTLTSTAGALVADQTDAGETGP